MYLRILFLRLLYTLFQVHHNCPLQAIIHAYRRILLHVLNRLVICLNYVTDPKRFLDIGNSGLTLPDLFLVLEKLMGYINSIDEITKSISIDSSDAILQKLADEKNDSSINSPESKEAVENFMKLFKKDAGIED